MPRKIKLTMYIENDSELIHVEARWGRVDEIHADNGYSYMLTKHYYLNPYKKSFIVESAMDSALIKLYDHEREMSEIDANVKP